MKLGDPQVLSILDAYHLETEYLVYVGTTGEPRAIRIGEPETGWHSEGVWFFEMLRRASEAPKELPSLLPEWFLRTCEKLLEMRKDEAEKEDSRARRRRKPQESRQVGIKLAIIRGNDNENKPNRSACGGSQSILMAQGSYARKTAKHRALPARDSPALHLQICFNSKVIETEAFDINDFGQRLFSLAQYGGLIAGQGGPFVESGVDLPIKLP